MDIVNFKELLDQYLTGTISPEGRSELANLIGQPQYREQLELLMQESLNSDAYLVEENPRLHDEIQGWLNTRINETSGAQPGNGTPTTKTRRLTFFRYAAAAAIIIVIATFAVVGLLTNNHPPSPVGVHANDVPAPKETRAVITLADGSKVYLDNTSSGTLAQQSNVDVVKTTDGKIVYNAVTLSGDEGSPVAYNTLTNPRGSTVIDMQLSDGSHVWLNAGSSVTYPVAFVGNERKVEITGEAYFEVAHNARKPFIVSKGETSVTVLGTHFNVNAYDDEDDLRVTLLEGSVRVKSEFGGQKSEKTIKPGEQVAINTSLNHFITTLPDLEAVMAWKNGRFNFNGTDIETILRQVARWYDVDVVYQTKVNEKFYADIPRNTKVSDVLKALELTNKVHFNIVGKKVFVTK